MQGTAPCCEELGQGSLTFLLRFGLAVRHRRAVRSWYFLNELAEVTQASLGSLKNKHYQRTVQATTFKESMRETGKSK